MSSADELTATVDGHQLFIDLSSLQGMTQPALLVPAVVVAVAAVVVVGVLARADLRPFLLSALATGTLGAAAALLSAPVVVGRLVTFVPALHARISEGSLLVGIAGFAVGALVALVPLAFFTIPRLPAVAVAVVGVVAGAAGVVGVGSAQDRRRTFVKALQQAFPVPRMVFAGQGQGEDLPEVQVGRTRLLSPLNYTQLGVEEELLFGVFGSRPAPFPAGEVGLWNLLEARATLEAKTPGVHETTAVAWSGPVRVVAPLSYRAVQDTAPAWLPLTTGTRIAWTRTSGSPGVTDRVLRAQQPVKPFGKKQRRGKPPAGPAEDVVVTIGEASVVDGFRVVEVHIEDKGQFSGGTARTELVFARDGVLLKQAGGVFAGSNCSLPFLEQTTCQCSSRGVDRCARVDGDNIGALFRVGLVIATLGFSEVMGACNGCGDGHEEGLLLVPPPR